MMAIITIYKAARSAAGNFWVFDVHITRFLGKNRGICYLPVAQFSQDFPINYSFRVFLPLDLKSWLSINYM